MTGRRGGSYGGTPVRGNGGWRGRGRFDFPPPGDMWGNPGFGRTEAGFRTRPGDRMNGANFWQMDGAQREFYNDMSIGHHDRSTPRGSGYNNQRGYRNQRGQDRGYRGRGQDKRVERKEELSEDKVGKGTVKDQEKVKGQEVVKDQDVKKSAFSLENLSEEKKARLGERIEKEGKFLFKFPETEEDQKRISGSVAKFFDDVRCELGDETFLEMFGGKEKVLGDIDTGAMGGVESSEPDVIIEKDLGTRSKDKSDKQNYQDSALGRLRFFDDKGDLNASSLGRGLVAGNTEEKDCVEPRGANSGSDRNSKPLGIAKPMTEVEKRMVNTVIEDIMDGRTDGGEKLWEDIRNRVIPEEDLALRYIGQFFRRQYNEGITKQQAEYCYIKLMSIYPNVEPEKRGTEKVGTEVDQLDKQEEDLDHLLDEEALDKFSKLAYDGNKDEARKACLRKSRQEFNDSQDIVPKELLDYKVGSFGNMEDYIDYMKEVTRRMVENVAVVEEKCRVNAINDRRKLFEKSPIQGASAERSGCVETLRSGDKTSSSKRVDFRPTPRRQVNGTYTLGADRPAKYSSTPNAPRAGMINNQDDSSILEDNMGLTSRELSIYEQYNVPVHIRRSTRIADTVNPLLSSTIAGDQNTGTMQSMFTMVPTGSSLDMFRQFNGQKSDFLEWKHETQILLRSVPEDLRAMKLKSLLKKSHKKLVGHIFYDDANATDKIWQVLKKNFGEDERMGDYHMDQLTGWMRDGRRCHDYESLNHLYNFIKTHYYGMARLGAEKIPMAESFAYAIAPLLYGRSQKEVNKLKHKDSFNVNKILDIIADHAKEVKDQETDKEKYEHRSEQYSEEDRKFLRDRYFEESGSSKYKRYSNSKDKYERSEWSSGDRYSKGVDRYHKNKDTSRDRVYDDRDGGSDYRSYNSGSHDRSRYGSQDKYRNGARDHSRYNFRQSDYTGNRSNSRDRGSSGERKVYYKKDRRERSDSRDSYRRGDQDRFSRDKYKKDGYEEDQEAVLLKAETEPEDHKEQPRYRRTRDQTPRGSRSKSPLRHPGSRSWNSWACSLCLNDDHKTISCRKYAAEEVYRICGERKLCYVCNLSGHTSSVCNADSLLCKSSSCKQDVNHNHLLCGKYKRS